MRLMRHKRTGKTAAYDEAVICNGNWEEVLDSPKPFNQDDVKAQDEISISITRGGDEGS